MMKNYKSISRININYKRKLFTMLCFVEEEKTFEKSGDWNWSIIQLSKKVFWSEWENESSTYFCNTKLHTTQAFSGTDELNEMLYMLYLWIKRKYTKSHAHVNSHII
jgi:hypothetical protein